MPPDILEFEEPIGVLLKEIEALSVLPRTAEQARHRAGQEAEAQGRPS
jgi:hypothetical protein